MSRGLGLFYEAASRFIFNSKYDAGKVMGLAPLGHARPIRDRVRFYKDLDWSKAFRGQGREHWQSSPHVRLYADIAASVQRHFEDSLLALLADLRRRHPDYPDLILTGGCALNCVANMKVVRSGLFKKVYVPPFPGDESIAFGAAQHLKVVSAGGRGWRAVDWSRQRCNFGPRDSIPKGAEILKIFSEFRCRRLKDAPGEAARLLQQGSILAWFQGRSESGPRALGFRSILANPMIPGLKDRLNRDIKGREDFRPYGCSTLWEKANLYFAVERGFDSPFMSFAPEVLPRYRRLLREVTHVDGTSRIQTVRRSQNAEFHHLIETFGRMTGVCVILNTSLNVMGEPIVETLDDLLHFFRTVPVDGGIVGNFLVERAPVIHRPQKKR